jgi:hypothetical protein
MNANPRKPCLLSVCQLVIGGVAAVSAMALSSQLQAATLSRSETLSRAIRITPKRILPAEQLTAATNQPTRLAFQAGTRSFTVSQPGEVTVELRNSGGAAVPAVRAVSVEVNAGNSVRNNITFQPGERSKTVRLVLNETGARNITATAGGLNAASLYVNVLPARPIPTRRLIVKLYSETQRIRANGRETANLHAFLVGGPNPGPQEVTLRFFPLEGITMTPDTLVIPRGSDTGKIGITAKTPGSRTIVCRSTTPMAEFDGEQQVKLECGEDISLLMLNVNTNISLLDEMIVSASFYNSEGNLVTNDVARPILLALKSDHLGSFQSNLTLEAGQLAAGISFRPKWVGTGTVETESSGFPRQIAVVHVRFPWPQVSVSLVIGALGGLIAAWRQKVRKKDFWWRVLVGGVTGSALYMGGVAGILSETVKGITVQMFGLILLSLLGGFLGTEVFTILLKRLGLVPDEAKESKRATRERTAAED